MLNSSIGARAIGTGAGTVMPCGSGPATVIIRYLPFIIFYDSSPQELFNMIVKKEDADSS
jgi:hypothetical protein